MAKYVPSPRDWVREQVELYENSGGTKDTAERLRRVFQRLGATRIGLSPRFTMPNSDRPQ